jgi:hypothetical protein
VFRFVGIEDIINSNFFGFRRGDGLPELDDCGVFV